MGLYQVLEAENGVLLIWNKKTEVMLKLSPSFKVKEKDVFTEVMMWFYFCLSFDWSGVLTRTVSHQIQHAI